MDEHLEPVDYSTYGATKVLPWLWLAGEDDITMEILQEIQLWIDFRHESIWNREIITPSHVINVKMPFKDGDLESAKRVYPYAKFILERAKSEGKTCLISCHAGVSRSATLALWMMAEEMGFEEAVRKLSKLRSIVEPDEAFYPLLKEWKEKYK